MQQSDWANKNWTVIIITIDLIMNTRDKVASSISRENGKKSRNGNGKIIIDMFLFANNMCL